MTTNFVELAAPVNAIPLTPAENNIAAIIRVNVCTIELSDTASEAFIQPLLGALAYVQ